MMATFRWCRAKLERDGRAFDADGKHIADHLRPFGLRPAILRVRKRPEPPPPMRRGYRRNDVLRAAARAGLPELGELADLT